MKRRLSGKRPVPVLGGSRRAFLPPKKERMEMEDRNEEPHGMFRPHEQPLSPFRARPNFTPTNNMASTSRFHHSNYMSQSHENVSSPLHTSDDLSIPNYRRSFDEDAINLFSMGEKLLANCQETGDCSRDAIMSCFTQLSTSNKIDVELVAKCALETKSDFARFTLQGLLTLSCLYEGVADQGQKLDAEVKRRNIAEKEMKGKNELNSLPIDEFVIPTGGDYLSHSGTVFKGGIDIKLVLEAVMTSMASPQVRRHLNLNCIRTSTVWKISFQAVIYELLHDKSLLSSLTLGIRDCKENGKTLISCRRPRSADALTVEKIIDLYAMGLSPRNDDEFETLRIPVEKVLFLAVDELRRVADENRRRRANEFYRSSTYYEALLGYVDSSQWVQKNSDNFATSQQVEDAQAAKMISNPQLGVEGADEAHAQNSDMHRLPLSGKPPSHCEGNWQENG